MNKVKLREFLNELRKALPSFTTPYVAAAASATISLLLVFL